MYSRFSCVFSLTAEEEMMNQDTILIMIGVGMGVVLFLIMLYCLQQRRNADPNQQGQYEILKFVCLVTL